VTDLRAILGDAALRLSIAGIGNPRLDARLLLAHALNLRPDALVGSVNIPAHAHARFEEFLARRILREPVAYIVGTKEFWSLEFEVGPGALIPRPETETLIEQLVEAFPDRAAPLEIADFGTGTGCLLVAALHEFPAATGTGIDRSADALGWARRNLRRHGLEGRARLELGSWDGVFLDRADAILANPPYVRDEEVPALPPEIRHFEPVEALSGGGDGLAAYRALAPLIARVLRPGGMAFLEIGAGQEESVLGLLSAQGLERTRVAADLAGIGRCVVAAQGRGIRP
jgi:release factor glutamine methyltransferase